MRLRWIQTILAFILVKPLFKIFFNLQVSGKENLEGLKGPLIITGNHKYYLDSFALGAALPTLTPLYHITTFGEPKQFNDKGIEFLRKTGFIKLLYFVLGIFPVIRGQDLKIALKEPLSIVNKGGVIFLHPEGKIVKEEGIGQFKRGAPFLAEETGAPILPVAFKINKEKSGWRKDYHVKFGPVFHLPKDLPLEEGASYMRSIIARLYEPLP